MKTKINPACNREFALKCLEDEMKLLAALPTSEYRQGRVSGMRAGLLFAGLISNAEHEAQHERVEKIINGQAISKKEQIAEAMGRR